MMRPLDLYQLTRINDNLFSNFENNLSGRQEKKPCKAHERDSLIAFVRLLEENNISPEGLRHFYYSYDIPQIGKEFDLLRINDEKALNIELKSRDVETEKIKKQLAQNLYYLSHLSREVILFAFVESSKKFYHLKGDGSLEKCSLDLLLNIIQKQINCFDGDINSLFKASEFLVSPLNTPQRFIQGKYFLTPQQENSKRDIIQKINESNGDFLFWGITGVAGTGKTLALFDLAHYYSKLDRACVFHCGILSDGHKYLSENIPGLDVYQAKSIEIINFEPYKYVFVDESHRLHEEQFDMLIRTVECNQLICIFSYDTRQVLSRKETRRKIVDRIQELSNFQEYKLSEKIRTNKEIASFIRRLFNLNHPDIQAFYPSISVFYANNEDDARYFIEENRKRGFVFINYTPSMYCSSSFGKYENDYNTHHVIGQEFDNVLMMIDDSFHYNEKGKLIAKYHPNPDYLFPKLLFQGLTRTRNKLALIVLDNKKVFEKILSILG